jgi:hypothetical protein
MCEGSTQHMKYTYTYHGREHFVAQRLSFLVSLVDMHARFTCGAADRQL